MEAEQFARRQRLQLAQLLRVDERDATSEEISLAKRVIQAGGMREGFDYDRALASKNVGDIFVRGILFFERPTP